MAKDGKTGVRRRRRRMMMMMMMKDCVTVRRFYRSVSGKRVF